MMHTLTPSHTHTHTLNTHLHFDLVVCEAVSHIKILHQVRMVDATMLVALKLLLYTGNLFLSVWYDVCVHI